MKVNGDQQRKETHTSLELEGVNDEQIANLTFLSIHRGLLTKSFFCWC